MSVKVLIPTVLRKYTDGQQEVQAEGNNLREVVQFVIAGNEPLQGMILNSKGEFNFLLANIFVNEEDARFLQKLDTPLKDGDEVAIVAAAAGGSVATKASVKVLISTPLRRYTEGQHEVQAEGANLRQAIEHLIARNSQLQAPLLDESGEFRFRIANIYLNDEDVRDLQKLDTPLKDGDTIAIAPATGSA